MKLATLKDGSRDGRLIVVDKTLKQYVLAEAIAHTMQQAIDHWLLDAPKLMMLYDNLNKQNMQAMSLDCKKLMAPLPRAYQWADGSAYVNHVELVRRARGAEMPNDFWIDPLMYQGGSDSFLGPNDDILIENTEWGIDFESEVAIITNDVPMGINAKHAAPHIALLMLVNDVSLRILIPNEMTKGFGFFNSKPSSAFSPVAVTPDELGLAWRDNKVHLPLFSYLNNQLFGKPNAGVDMTFDFATLIAHAAKTRKLTAGTIIGSGTVSNLDRSVGSSCIAERRMLEIIADGKPVTSFMQFGDRIKIEMQDYHGESIFGAIDQQVARYFK